MEGIGEGEGGGRPGILHRPGDRRASRRAEVWGLLARAFLDEPDERLLTWVRELPAEGAGGEGLVPSPSLAAAVQEFQDLLKVPGPRFTTPFASVFLDPPREEGSGRLLLGGPTSRQVQRFFQAAGLEPGDTRYEPGDHLGVECAFMAELAGAIEEQAGAVGEEELGTLREIQRRFLCEHLALWVERWQAKLLQHAQLDLYPRLAALLSGWVQEELRGMGDQEAT